jgi:hypothetical protein
MKIRFGLLLIALFVFVGLAGSAAAGDKATHKKVRTLTGCLQQGDEAKEFNFTANGGAKWDVKSDAVDLAPHVGHTVTITGTVDHAKTHAMKEDVKGEAKEHGLKKEAKESGDLTVTNVTMVSTTCQK